MGKTFLVGTICLHLLSSFLFGLPFLALSVTSSSDLIFFLTKQRSLGKNRHILFREPSENTSLTIKPKHAAVSSITEVFLCQRSLIGYRLWQTRSVCTGKHEKIHKGHYYHDRLILPADSTLNHMHIRKCDPRSIFPGKLSFFHFLYLACVYLSICL